MTVGSSDGELTYLVADEVATLVYLANLAALEIHAPQWRAIPDSGRGAEPVPLAETRSDILVVDLDPGEGLATPDLARAAMLAGGVLATDGLTPLVKTSGSKGLQLYAPIAPTPGRVCTAYAQELGRRLLAHEPDLFVGTVTVAERAGRVYVDHNQNLPARTTVAPYSLRGKNAFPNVSTPLEWDEVAALREPADLVFDPDRVLARVAERGDLFADLLGDAPRPALPELADG